MSPERPPGGLTGQRTGKVFEKTHAVARRPLGVTLRAMRGRGGPYRPRIVRRVLGSLAGILSPDCALPTDWTGFTGLGVIRPGR